MRVPSHSLGSLTDLWYCGFGNGVWDGSECINTTQPPAVPASVQISLPVGYDPATGMLDPTNTTGLTQTGGPNPLAPAQSFLANQANQAACQSEGGNWSPATGICSPNYTPYLIAAGVAVVVLIFVLRR